MIIERYIEPERHIERHAGRRHSGFTLIEIMVSLMVFALFFAVALPILSTWAGNTRRAVDLTQAALWAQARLHILGVEDIIEPGTTSGRFDDNFSCELEVIETEVADDRTLDFQEDLPIALYHIYLTVYWDDGRRQAEFETMRSVDTHWEERQQQMMGAM